jgi:hypothetical protein
MIRIKIFHILALSGLLGSGSGSAFADTCACQAPCSGSITCAGGCYALCEENPENSGRHVCVKGCAAETSDTSTAPSAAPANPATPSAPRNIPESMED